MQNATIEIQKEICKTQETTFIAEWKMRREKEAEWFEKWTNTDEYKKTIDDLKKQNAEQGLNASSAG